MKVSKIDKTPPPKSPVHKRWPKFDVTESYIDGKVNNYMGDIVDSRYSWEDLITDGVSSLARSQCKTSATQANYLQSVEAFVNPWKDTEE